MNIAVWVAAGLPPAAYLLVGGMKLLTPKFHGRRGKYKQWPVNAVFLALAVFIAAVRISEVVR